MSYRDDLAALSARHAALEAEVADRARELAQATRLLEEARARARLPVLDDVRVASPCEADWDGMVGGERVRRCGACRKDVYNLSAMTRDEAEALIVASEGRLCVRYFRRADGTILLKDDCAIGVERRRRRRRRHAAIAAAAGLLAAAGAVLGWRPSRPAAPEPSDIELRGRPTIGKYDGVRPGEPSQSQRFE